MEWIIIIGVTIAAIIGFKIIFWVIGTIKGKPDSEMAKFNKLSADTDELSKKMIREMKRDGLL